MFSSDPTQLTRVTGSGGLGLRLREPSAAETVLTSYAPTLLQARRDSSDAQVSLRRARRRCRAQTSARVSTAGGFQPVPLLLAAREDDADPETEVVLPDSTNVRGEVVNLHDAKSEAVAYFHVHTTTVAHRKSG